MKEAALIVSYAVICTLSCSQSREPDCWRQNVNGFEVLFLSSDATAIIDKVEAALRQPNYEELLAPYSQPLVECDARALLDNIALDMSGDIHRHALDWLRDHGGY